MPILYTTSAANRINSLLYKGDLAVLTANEVR